MISQALSDAEAEACDRLEERMSRGVVQYREAPASDMPLLLSALRKYHGMIPKLLAAAVLLADELEAKKAAEVKSMGLADRS